MSQTLTPGTLKSWLRQPREIAVLDVREHGQYGESHLFHATPLPYSRLELDIARLVPRRQTRVVVHDSGAPDTGGVAGRAAARLEALGYEAVFVLQGGTAGWAGAGHVLFAGVNLPSKTFGELAEAAYHTPRVSADQLAAMLASATPPVVLDGRPVAEFRKMNIPTAVCCPNGELALRVASLVPDHRTPIVVNCAGRTRSIVGAQTLINLGLPNPVFALENGTQGWFLSGRPLEHGGTRQYARASAGNALKAGAQALAERFEVPRITAEAVRAWVAADDRNVFLCDVRTPEEFAAGSLPGAQHTPGGQLMQAADQYIGVRGARLVLFDDDAIRAPTVASWLRQMGHDACVLIDGLHSGLALAMPRLATPPRLQTITAAQLAARMAAGEVAVIDLRSSMQFRTGHVPGARWASRQRLAQALQHETRPCVLVSEEPLPAAWAAATDWPQHLATPQLLAGGFAGWCAEAGAVEATPEWPADADCIDYLFFTHDRHDGNQEAARRYLQWETGLVAQLDGDEIATFRLPEPADHGTPA